MKIKNVSNLHSVSENFQINQNTIKRKNQPGCSYTASNEMALKKTKTFCQKKHSVDLLEVLLQKLIQILFGDRTCQDTVIRVFSPGHISPADEYYGEYGVKFDDLFHRVKHLRRKKRSVTANQILFDFPRVSLTSLDLCPVPSAYLLTLSMYRTFTLQTFF